MKQAVILAAGEGRRLRLFTINKPKAMLSIAGKPVIQYVLESLAENGIRDIIFIVGYHKEQIFDYIGDGKQFGVEVKFISQDKQLGSAHALAQAAGQTDSDFLVLPGDKLISPETISDFIGVESPSILVKRENIPSRYGVATVKDGRLTGIAEKPAYPESNIINTGIYAFNKSIFDFMGSKLDIPDVLNDLLRLGETINAVETNRTWLDIVYPWDILKLNAAILQKTPAVHNGITETYVSIIGHVAIGRGTLIHANSYITGPVVIGTGCEIGPNVCIFPSTSIADNVVISPFTEIKNSVISDDVNIGSGSSIQDSVIDRGCIIGGHFCARSEETEINMNSENHNVKVGAMLGEGCHLGNGVVAQPGVILGNYCQVKSLKMLSGNLPDKSLVV
jgi:UDP-N-acetylglucosamine diphosphorylase / glucose-1-phosphate thymidylyltransferase / UDP-N-acetylgalactosamine diphosphorylase / glucosamine-1-phosphate N-acetyltransferase / galactosamine-1-phosphate N-acetyltransferase